MNAAQDTPGHEGRAQGQTRPTAEPDLDSLQLYRYPWRRTRMGAVTANYVLCMTCRQPLQPRYSISSKGGTHGYDEYLHEQNHRLESITLLASNTGKKRYTCSSTMLERLAYRLFITWLRDGNLPSQTTFSEYADDFMREVTP